MYLPEPLSIVDTWLHLCINPQISRIGINSKIAASTAFYSTGIEISLSPLFQDNFTPDKENEVTVGKLQDIFIADILHTNTQKYLIKSFEVFKDGIDKNDLNKYLKTNPPIGRYKYPQIAYFEYPDQGVLFFFKKFSFAFKKELFQNCETVSTFLFYKAKSIEEKMYSRKDAEEVLCFRENAKKYQKFLIDLLVKSEVEE